MLKFSGVKPVKGC